MSDIRLRAPVIFLVGKGRVGEVIASRPNQFRVPGREIGLLSQEDDHAKKEKSSEGERILEMMIVQ